MNRKERRAAGSVVTPPPSPGRGADRPDAIAAALLARGRELLAKGEDEAALLLACRVIGLEESPGTRAFFIQCVKDWSYFPGADEIQPTLARALREAWTWPIELLVPALGILERDSAIGPALRRVGEAWPRRLSCRELLGLEGFAAIADRPLLPALLESTVVPDRRFERFLTGLRSAVLETAVAGRGRSGDAVVALAAALAQQCFINEYVFAATPEEEERLAALREMIDATVHANRPVAALWLAACAAYDKLEALPGKALQRKEWPRSIARLLDQQLREQEAIQRYRATVPRLTPIVDEISVAVKAQYEENPYPRWVKSSAVPFAVKIEDHLRREFSHQSVETPGSGPDLDILIAGCGTGQQSIDFAQRYQGAKVLAVDLAMSSLAYATAKTAAAGLANIDYAAADILDLAGLGKSFDVVVSTGVLHHLRDPMAGWRVLASLLRPRGLMYIGLYSETARRGIVAAQKWISERRYRPTPDGIRACRQEMAQIDDPAWHGVFAMIDFYSTSECRDLLFHVHEHCFTIPDIARFLDENGLRFIGFHLPAAVRRRFRSRYPAPSDFSDLHCWEAFERDNPDTFINMYQFWVQKPAAAAAPPA